MARAEAVLNRLRMKRKREFEEDRKKRKKTDDCHEKVAGTNFKTAMYVQFMLVVYAEAFTP